MEVFDLILRNGQVLVPNPSADQNPSRDPNDSQNRLKSVSCDVGVRNGKIVALSPTLSGDATQVIDARGLHVLPGVIDSQVHFREPGLTHKEDLETGTKAALLGGITSIFEMPNTMPPTIHIENLEEKFQRARGRAHVHYGFFAGASAENYADLAGLEKHPHCPGIKVFMGSSTGTLLVDSEEVLEKIFQNTRRRLIFHSEDEARLKERKHLSQQNHDVRWHPVWRDVESAVISTKKIIALSRKYNHFVHVLHVSTADEMELLKTEKRLASIEVLPNHLTLWAPECYEKLGNYAQQNPPIREKAHHDGLWKAVQMGIVDIIGSDHAPHTKEEKDRPYPQSPSGTPGVQTLLPVMLNHVHEGRLSLERLTEMITENPRRVFGVQGKGRIEVGYDADFTLVDLRKTRTIENSWIASRCGWTPFDGMKVTGWPIYTILKGHVAMAEDQIIKPAQGEPVSFQSY